MRGLRKPEREALVAMSSAGPIDEVTEWTDVEKALVAASRARLDTETDPQFDVLVPTAFGDLALRVCPTEEA